MKKLYLLRHAEASHPRGVDDHERPLNDNGVKECGVINSYILQNNIIPQIVLCSNATRTKSTAKNVLSNVDVNILFSKKLYNATAGEILKEIAKIPDENDSAMVIGHNPGIGQLAFLLAAGGNIEELKKIRDDYPTCTLTQYSFDLQNWQNVEIRSGVFDWVVRI